LPASERPVRRYSEYQIRSYTRVHSSLLRLPSKRQRHAENAAREAEEEAASVRAEAAAAQSQLRKATAYATSLTAARAVADEKARNRKLREAADRLAPPKSD
jgi:hypothetical protein